MDVRTTTHIRTHLYLDRIEEFIHENEKGPLRHRSERFQKP